MEVSADSQLDALIGKRARMEEQSRDEEESWKESVRKFHDIRLREIRAQWYGFHLDQAERIERTAAELVSHHRKRAEALLEDGEVTM